MKYLDNALLVGWVRYALCLNPADYQREMKRLKVADPSPFLIEGRPATTHFYSPKDDSTTAAAIVCLNIPEGHDAISVAALIVHEAVHIWQYECELMGEDSPGDEVEAYGIQRISSNLMRAYVELTRG